MDIKVVFGRNFARYRKAAGLTQAAVAAEMDVDRAHVSLMERGMQNVTLETLAGVARALGTTPVALIRPLEADDVPQ